MTTDQKPPFTLYSFTVTVEAPTGLPDSASSTLVEDIEPVVDSVCGAFADALAEIFGARFAITMEEAEKLGFKVVVAR
jgi:hypothetical protein